MTRAASSHPGQRFGRLARFTRILAADLREGFRETRRWYAAEAAMLLALSCSLFITTGPWDPKRVFSLGDHLVNLVEGAPAFSFDPGGTFVFPATWALVVLSALYLTLWYPARDLAGFGAHVLVAGRSRWAWWLSKCCWVVCSSLVSCALGLGTALVVTAASGGELALDAPRALAAARDWTLRAAFDQRELVTFLLGVPVALGALGLVQLALSVAWHPVIAFAASLAQLVLAAFVVTPLLPGNALMAVRSLALVEGGIAAGKGLAASLALGVLGIVFGGLAFSRIDLIDKER